MLLCTACNRRHVAITPVHAPYVKVRNIQLKVPAPGGLPTAEQAKLACEKDQKNGRLWFEFALTLYRDSRYGEALAVLNSRSVQPLSRTAVLYWSGLCNLGLNKHENAEACFVELTAISKQKPRLHSKELSLLAYTYYLEFKDQESLRCCKDALAEDKDNLRAQNIQKEILVEQRGAR